MELKLNQLLLAIIESDKQSDKQQEQGNPAHQVATLTQTRSYNDLKTTCIKIKNKIDQLNETQKQNRKNEAASLYQNFYKTLVLMADEVKAAKKKYMDLDRQKLTDEKCLELAKGIRDQRNQCYELREKIKLKKKQLLKMQAENHTIKVENEGNSKLIKSREQENCWLKSEFSLKKRASSTNHNQRTTFSNLDSIDQKTRHQASRSKSRNIKKLNNFILLDNPCTESDIDVDIGETNIKSINSNTINRVKIAGTQQSFSISTDLTQAPQNDRYHLHSREKCMSKNSNILSSQLSPKQHKIFPNKNKRAPKNYYGRIKDY